jgi:transcriptional regulator GlxA family with amidase domain
MLRNVAVVVLNGFTPFELGVVSEVFGSDRSDDGLPAYDFAVVAAEPGPVSSSAGFTLQTEFGLDRLAQADLVVMSAISDEYCAESISFPEPLLDALRATVARGGRVLSVCSGAFALGAAGLLDGRTCTTHWRHAAELARRFLVRKEQGSRVANGIARRMVVPPHRDGGQAQYVDRPLAALSCDTLAGVISWMERHLDRPVSIRQLAARAAMSPRTFARRFVAETGTTPQRWLTGQRILLAQELLEETDETVDLIAERAGFGNATVLRHHFRLWRDTTPNAYRRAFRPAAGSPGPGSPGPRSLQHGSLQHGSLEHGGNGRVAARQLQGVGG